MANGFDFPEGLGFGLPGGARTGTREGPGGGGILDFLGGTLGSPLGISTLLQGGAGIFDLLSGPSKAERQVKQDRGALRGQIGKPIFNVTDLISQSRGRGLRDINRQAQRLGDIHGVSAGAGLTELLKSFNEQLADIGVGAEQQERTLRSRRDVGILSQLLGESSSRARG